MTFVLAFLFLLIIVAGMSIGVLLTNKPIKGSCGGMSALGIDTACDICGGDKNKCEKEQESVGDTAKSISTNEALAYDAMNKKLTEENK